MQSTAAAIGEIAKALRKHVERDKLQAIIEELLDTRGDRAFREIIQQLARELGVRLSVSLSPLAL
jgi:hypothetical protein